MALIPCNEINQTIALLRASFQDCTKLKAEDMQLLLDLIVSMDACSNGSVEYNTLNNDIYEPEIDETVTYPANTFHSISIVVSAGQAVYDDITLSTGTSINLEFTTLNNEDFTFIAKAGSKVLVNYITETIL